MAGGEMSPASLRKLLGSLGAHDLVEAIKDAIAIAACSYPRELEQSLGRSIPELLAATPADESASLTEKVDDWIKEQHDGHENRPASSDVALTVTEQVATINSRLASEGNGRPSSEAVLESLRELKAVRMTFEALQETKIGRTVSGLRKQYASSEEVRELAGDLYKGWKALADEHYRSRKTSPAGASAASDAKAKSATSQETQPAASCGAPKVVERVGGSPPPKSAPSAAKAKEAATRRPGPIGSSAGERKEDIDEAKLATAKRKLQEGYKEADAVKKQKRVQFIAAPGKTNTSQRPAVQQPCVVRRTAAATGKSVPAPLSFV